MIDDNGRDFTTILEENIPTELQELDQWVCWRGDWSESKEKLNKVPKQPNGNAASSTDESTWTAFGVALTAAREKARFGIGLAGLGKTPYTGLDLDNCMNRETGEIHPAALKIVEGFDSYTEITPSGDGLRIWIEAEKSPTWSTNTDGETDIEVYSSGRYFTVTGRHLEGTPRTIERRQTALDAFMRDHAPSPQERPARDPYKGSGDGFILDLDRFLEEFGVEILGPYKDRSSEKAYRIVCPWAHEHTGGDTSGTRVGQYESGGLWFRCDHAHCAGRKWQQFREELDPEAYRRVKLTVGAGGAHSEDAPRRFQRADLAGALEHGIEPEEMLVDDVLYAPAEVDGRREGRVHSIHAKGGTGKTFLALWVIKRCLLDEQSVVFLDQENGLHTIVDRLQTLGVRPELVRDYLHYYPFPSAPIDDEALGEYQDLLEEVRPVLIVFDSWINFLAAAGLDENSSNDVAQWSEAYAQAARRGGASVLLLDHVPKEGKTGARGSGRKRDYVDLQWELLNPQPFDRRTVGRIELRKEKDRQGWMPFGVAFTVGTNEDGRFIFGPAIFDSSISTDGILTSRERSVLGVLESFGDSGAQAVEWQREARRKCGISESTFYRFRAALLEGGHVREVGGRYFAAEGGGSENGSSVSAVFPPEAESGGGSGGSEESGIDKPKGDHSQSLPNHSHDSDGSGATGDHSHHSHPPIGGSGGSTRADSDDESVVEDTADHPLGDDEGRL
jgi:hypothetical protein